MFDVEGFGKNKGRGKRCKRYDVSSKGGNINRNLGVGEGY